MHSCMSIILASLIVTAAQAEEEAPTSRDRLMQVADCAARFSPSYAVFNAVISKPWIKEMPALVVARFLPRSAAASPAASAPAVPISGVQVVDATDARAAQLGLQVCNLYVQFDSPNNRLLNVGFAKISTDDPNGFYQHKYGSDMSPPQPLVEAIPDLAYDTFVDIGRRFGRGASGGASAVDPDFNSSEFNHAGAIDGGGWFNANPDNGQGAPDNNGRVFVGQFTVRRGFGVSGSMSVFFNKGTVQVPVAFEYGDDGTADINSDGRVDAADLMDLLSSWGPGHGRVADHDRNGWVNVRDLRWLLEAWPTSAQPAQPPSPFKKPEPDIPLAA